MTAPLVLKIRDMLHGWDYLNLSQFTIDWIQEFEDSHCENVTESSDRALAYEIGVILDFARYGSDRDFFAMLDKYCDFFLGNYK